MNIESLKSTSPPQRGPLPETQKLERSATEQTKPSIATKTLDANKSLRADQDKGRDNPSGLTAQDAVKRLNDFVAPTQSQISFSIDQESGVSVVKIIDTQSKEVIRQFPSEEAIALAQALDKLQGLLIKDKA
jgi:flagellar protein FlaG